jgi:holo-[acyl-carrier protein] synthase
MGIFGMGTDLVRVDRISRLLRAYGDRFLNRVYHMSEVTAARQRDEAGASAYLAGRWAVKEATQKAFPRWRIARDQVYTTTDPLSGQPLLNFVAGSTVEAVASRHNVDRCHVSVSHDGDYAVATVIVEVTHGPVLDTRRPLSELVMETPA